MAVVSTKLGPSRLSFASKDSDHRCDPSLVKWLEDCEVRLQSWPTLDRFGVELMALIVGLAVALTLWFVARWLVDSFDRRSQDSSSAVEEGRSSSEGMCLAVLRRTGLPVLRRWRYGAFYSSDRQVWWESRWGLGQESLNGLSVVGERSPTPMETFRWGSHRTVLQLEGSDGVRLECAVEAADSQFVTDVLGISR